MPPTISGGSRNQVMGYTADNLLLQYNNDPRCLRPIMEVNTKGRSTGRAYVTLDSGRRDNAGKRILIPKFITNAPAVLRREDWTVVDNIVKWQKKTRLQLWNLMRSKVPENIPDAYGRSALETIIADGTADATISWDGTRRGERSKPIQDIQLMPLPIIHSDGSWTRRQIAVSNNSHLPLETNGIRLATRAVLEVIENLCLGTQGYTDAIGTIYGLINNPWNSTKVMTTPTSGGWTPKTFVDEVISMMQTLYNNKFYGPYSLIYSNGWKQYFETDYTTTYASDTLRTRLAKLADIDTFQNADSLTDYRVILAQWDADYITAAQGQTVVPVQYVLPGGEEVGYKVWGMQYPHIHPDYSGKVPINYGIAYAGGTTTTTTTTTTTSTTTTSTTTS